MTISNNTRPAAAGIDPPWLDEAALLARWRHQDDLGHGEAAALREVLVRLHLLLFTRWADAARGDAGAAIRIGIHVAADPTSPLWLVDYVGSALWLCARAGSQDAACVLRHLGRWYDRRCGAGEDA
jgi:hypothetical protein